LSEHQHLLLLRYLVVKVLIYIKMLFISSTWVLIRHLWQLKTTVLFMYWCSIVWHRNMPASKVENSAQVWSCLIKMSMKKSLSVTDKQWYAHMKKHIVNYGPHVEQGDCGQSYKKITVVNHNPSKIIYGAHSMHANMHCT